VIVALPLLVVMLFLLPAMLFRLGMKLDMFAVGVHTYPESRLAVARSNICTTVSRFTPVHVASRILCFELLSLRGPSNQVFLGTGHTISRSRQFHLFRASLIGDTYWAVPWGWHSETAVIEGAGCVVIVPVVTGSTCAAADAARSRIAVDIADRAAEAIFQIGTEKGMLRSGSLPTAPK
jgi:hypothetical protein